MSNARDAFADHCVELLSALGATRAKRMFGGVGLYVDDLFVALIAHDCLYLKVDASTRARFEAEGCEPFTYDGKGKPMTMSYFSAPQDAMDSPPAMLPWARLAFEAALRAQADKPAKAVSARRNAPAAAAVPRASPRKEAAKPARTKAPARKG
ncbi:MAG: TfoX/Sxy family protein [Rhizobacter sp.]|nr:TfoX/Sxy family protein [Rhizobacter sp.]